MIVIVTVTITPYFKFNLPIILTFHQFISYQENYLLLQGARNPLKKGGPQSSLF